MNLLLTPFDWGLLYIRSDAIPPIYSLASLGTSHLSFRS